MENKDREGQLIEAAKQYALKLIARKYCNDKMSAELNWYDGAKSEAARQYHSLPTKSVDELRDEFSRWVNKQHWPQITINDLFNFFLPHLQQIQEQKENDWISVKDKKPELGAGVNIYLDSGFITTGYLAKTKSGKVWQIFGTLEKFNVNADSCVLYWQPLPTPPNS